MNDEFDKGILLNVDEGFSVLCFCFVSQVLLLYPLNEGFPLFKGFSVLCFCFASQVLLNEGFPLFNECQEECAWYDSISLYDIKEDDLNFHLNWPTLFNYWRIEWDKLNNNVYCFDIIQEWVTRQHIFILLYHERWVEENLTCRRTTSKKRTKLKNSLRLSSFTPVLI